MMKIFAKRMAMNYLDFTLKAKFERISCNWSEKFRAL
jgi:hypothetical protein